MECSVDSVGYQFRSFGKAGKWIVSSEPFRPVEGRESRAESEIDILDLFTTRNWAQVEENSVRKDPLPSFESFHR